MADDADADADAEVVALPLHVSVQQGVAELAEIVHARGARAYAAFYVGSDGAVYLNRSAYSSGDLAKLWEGADWLAATLLRDLVQRVEPGTCSAVDAGAALPVIAAGHLADREVYFDAESEPDRPPPSGLRLVKR